MPDDSRKDTLTVALLGNPNTGKSTLFGAIVGVHQHVGNYPGVTVEKKTGDFKQTYPEIFEGLARAISRNVLVIAIGFIPMFFSTLVPYITVGSFFFSIMLVSGAVTMILLPSIFIVFKKRLLPQTAAVKKHVEENVINK